MLQGKFAVSIQSIQVHLSSGELSDSVKHMVSFPNAENHPYRPLTGVVMSFGKTDIKSRKEMGLLVNGAKRHYLNYTVEILLWLKFVQNTTATQILRKQYKKSVKMMILSAIICYFISSCHCSLSVNIINKE